MTERRFHLSADGLTVGYDGKIVLDGISIGVARGEVVALFGPNGSGKSSALKGLMGLAPRLGGAVVLAGEAITHRTTWEIARRGIGYVPQDDQAFQRLTVLENLEFGGMFTPPDDRKARLATVYSHFPVLAERRGQLAASLSGGERAMLSMGMALMVPNHSALILDEPLAGLSPLMADAILDLIRGLARQLDLAVLVVEQNVLRTLPFADRAYILRLGKIVFEGAADSFEDDRQLWQYF